MGFDLLAARNTEHRCADRERVHETNGGIRRLDAELREELRGSSSDTVRELSERRLDPGLLIRGLRKGEKGAIVLGRGDRASDRRGGDARLVDRFIDGRGDRGQTVVDGAFGNSDEQVHPRREIVGEMTLSHAGMLTNARLRERRQALLSKDPQTSSDHFFTDVHRPRCLVN
jgi:hypothetical protein